MSRDQSPAPAATGEFTDYEIMRLARGSGFTTGMLDYADGTGQHPFVSAIGANLLPALRSFTAAIERRLNGEKP